MPANTTGSWGPLLKWPLMGIHAVVTQDGKVLTFGTDDKGVQGATMYHDLWDPVTGVHTTINHHTHTPTDIFCSAAVIVPGTNKVLIAGGDARPLGGTNTGVNDTNMYDAATKHIMPAEEGKMNFERWYPSAISLSSGQVVLLGGSNRAGAGNATAEIYTPGEGWRALSGAVDGDLAASSSYPRSWVNSVGDVVYFATGSGNNGQYDVMALDPSGSGTLKKLGNLPFQAAWDSPAVMFEAGKVLISASNNDLWIMDITGATPVFTKTTSLSQERNWGNMTTLADGKVLINGGTRIGNAESGADKRAAIWDPATGAITYGEAEAQPRLYHSSSVLLNDGSVLSLGGGASGSSEKNYLDGQVYKPPYLFDASGNPAKRPVISDVPASVEPGQTFTIKIDDASQLSKLTFVKSGAATHAFNMEARMVNLTYKLLANNTVEVTVPANAHDVSAGSWMLFAWNKAGTPSIAPMVEVKPTLPLYDGIGELRSEFFLIDASVSSLDQIKFDGTPSHVEYNSEIREGTGGAFYTGGPSDRFAVKYTGELDASKAGSYTFFLNSDDGARLYIDGKLVVDNDGLHAATEKSATVTLTAGRHKVEVRYFEQGGDAVVDLDWSGPGFTREQMKFDGLEKNLIVNGAMELAGVNPNTNKIVNKLPGWTSSKGQFELWGDGFDGMNSTSGRTFLEVDAVNGDLSQSVKTAAGKVYSLGFDYAGRKGFVASSKMEVLWNGKVIATITPKDSVFENYKFSVTGTGGNDQLTFRSVAGDTDGAGGLLDSVVLKLDPTALNRITGTAAADLLAGTDGDDEILGLGGNDTFYGGKGNDVIDGGDGDYNQVDYDGKASDYTFTKNADGSITVKHPVYGTDTLKNIDGFWFYGEAKWYAPEDLLPKPPGKTINGTAGNDGLVGTNGDDVINGLAGNDTMYGGRGDDVMDGGTGDYNQVDYDGAAKDYTFTRNADGSFTVKHPTFGTDILKNIDGLWFMGEAKWYAPEDLLPPPPGKTINGTAGRDLIDGTDGDDIINGFAGDDSFFGGRGNDTFNGGEGYDQVDYNGKRADYTIKKNADGTLTLSHATWGTDTLKDIDGLYFYDEGKWYDPNTIA